MVERRKGSALLPLAISMGCPVGIGPEIIVKLMTAARSTERPAAVVVGDISVLRRAMDCLRLDARPVAWSPGEPLQGGTLPVYQVGGFRSGVLRWGHPDALTGQAMGRYIEEAVRLIEEGHCSALVTCPISKASLHQGGYFFPGHTEMLASLCEAERVRMMMAGSRLKVVLVTIHEPLRQVGDLLSHENISDCITMTADSLQRDFALLRPRIAVAGLNPHGGEGGMFGNEEQEIIRPAVATWRGSAK